MNMDYVHLVIVIWLFVLLPAYHFFRWCASGNPRYRQIYFIFRNLNASICISVSCSSVAYLFGLPTFQSFLVVFLGYHIFSVIGSKAARESSKPFYSAHTTNNKNSESESSDVELLDFWPPIKRSMTHEVYSHATAAERRRLASILGEHLNRPGYWMPIEISVYILFFGLTVFPWYWTCITGGVFMAAFFLFHRTSIYSTRHKLLRELFQSKWAVRRPADENLPNLSPREISRE